MSDFDSTAETLRHIRKVQSYLGLFVRDLMARGEVHDDSKLVEPEKAAFDRETPMLKTLTFGSDDYKASLSRLGEALSHHYAANSHHPEHYPNGVSGMSLMDIVEMLADWKAASERQAGGTMNLGVAMKRFGIEGQLAAILTNEARLRGWVPMPTTEAE